MERGILMAYGRHHRPNNLIKGFLVKFYILKFIKISLTPLLFQISLL